LAADYPVDVLNWDKYADSGPSLAEARHVTNKTLAGGLSIKTLLEGTEEDVLKEARRAIAQTEGRGLILTPTCTINGRSPEVNLKAIRRAVEEFSVL
jgi:uroporphyrinogen decarboxylase